MTEPLGAYEDAVIAAVDLAGRAGARDITFGFLHEDRPDNPGWYLHVTYQGARVMTGEHRTATAAAMDLAERLLTGAACRCGLPVALSDGVEGCRWRLVGQRWEPSCDAPAIRVEGKHGDHAAMRRAMAATPGNRAERRAARKAGRDG